MDCINRNQKAEANNAGVTPLQVIYGDCSLGIKGGEEGKGFQCIFSYPAGGLESLVSGGREWLYRVPKPTFWRATTDNDRGNRFPQRSGMWLAADMFMQCAGIKILVDGLENNSFRGPENNQYQQEQPAQKVEIIYTYETVTSPTTTVNVSYQVKKTGVIKTTVHYAGKEGLPELPVLGMRFIMPTCADKFKYEGLSGETYPDRKAGGIHGIYEVEGLPVTPYLVPQDCGMHMDTDWLEVYRSTSLDNSNKNMQELMLRFEMDKLPFSCLPYTAGELENATHLEELPVPRRTVVCIYGAVRGVGGIDSWGADVETQYHVSGEKDIEFSFSILL